jgi:hypothetical protein
MIDFSFTSLVFAAGLIAGATLDLLLLRTLLAPPFRIWPTPEPGSWQSLSFWGLFRGGMVLTFVTAALDWNSTPLLDWTRLIPGLPLGLIGLFITVCGYFNTDRALSRRPGTACSRRAEEAVTPNELSNALQ